MLERSLLSSGIHNDTRRAPCLPAGRWKLTEATGCTRLLVDGEYDGTCAQEGPRYQNADVVRSAAKDKTNVLGATRTSPCTAVLAHTPQWQTASRLPHSCRVTCLALCVGTYRTHGGDEPKGRPQTAPTTHVVIAGRWSGTQEAPTGRHGRTCGHFWAPATCPPPVPSQRVPCAILPPCALDCRMVTRTAARWTAGGPGCQHTSHTAIHTPVRAILH